MTQNRNKLLDLLAGNLANAVVHKVLEEAAEDEPLRKYYDDELSNSIEITKIYREKMQKIRESYSESSSRCFSEETYSFYDIDRIIASSELFSFPNILEITDAAQKIQEQNDKAQLQSCAVIY